jgi:hypothetical protein
MSSFMTDFEASQACESVSSAQVYAATAYYEYGRLGFFSIRLMYLILFLGVVVIMLVSTFVRRALPARTTWSIVGRCGNCAQELL